MPFFEAGFYCVDPSLKVLNFNRLLKTKKIKIHRAVNRHFEDLLYVAIFPEPFKNLCAESLKERDDFFNFCQGFLQYRSYKLSKIATDLYNM